MIALISKLLRRDTPVFGPSVDALPHPASTRFEIVEIAGKNRFIFVFESPVQLLRSGRGEYDDVAGTVQMRIEWSTDKKKWMFYRFRDAPDPESRKADGTWVYRSMSEVIVTPHNSQFARLCVFRIRKRCRRGLDPA
jgi:hypothetical protein